MNENCNGMTTVKVKELVPLSSQLARLHQSLDDEGKWRLNDSLLLAEQVTKQKCTELICPFCAAASIGRLGKAHKDPLTLRWMHSDHGQYFNCAAGPIHDSKEEKATG